jgi:MOSC domain-containing protein
MATTLAGLHVYPVKGLKGIDLQASRCTARGLEHDRRFMVVDAANEFLTQREHPRMATVWTDIAGDSLLLSAPDAGEVAVPLVPTGPATLNVRVWRSECAAAPVSRQADVWLSEQLGLACRLVYMPDTTRRLSNPDYAGSDRLVGFADGYAYLITGTASLTDLNARLASRRQPPLPMNRFRPNMVVAGAAAYAEDGWKDIRIGGAVLRAAKPCGRCQVTTTDQTTGEVTGPEPLATLSTYRDSSEFGVMFGMNYVTLEPGVVRVGDAVENATASRSSA